MSLKREGNLFLSYPGWSAGLLTLAGLLLLRWWLDFNGLYGQDSYDYVAYGSALKDWLGGAPMSRESFWPAGYPMTGALLSYITGDIAFAFQLVSILSIAATVGLLADLARPYLRSLHAILLPLAFVAASPYLLRSGLTAMSDPLAVVVIAKALWASQKVRMDPKGPYIVLLIFLAAFGTWVRYPAGILLGGMVLIQVPLLLRNRAYFWPGFGLFLAAIPVYLHFQLQPEIAPGHHFLDTWTADNWFRTSFVMEDGAFDYTRPNIIYALGAFYHPGFLGVLAFLAPVAGFRWGGMTTFSRAMLVLTLLYLLFIAGIPFQNTRFLVVLIPFLAFALFHPGSKLPAWIAQRPKWVTLGLCLLILVNLGLAGYTNKSFWHSANNEVIMAEKAKEHHPKRIFTFGMDGALRYHLKEAEVVNLWNNTLSADEWQAKYQPQPSELVLFNEVRFADQWEGKSPMRNWNYLKENFQMDTLAAFEGGWFLYEFK